MNKTLFAQHCYYKPVTLVLNLVILSVQATTRSDGIKGGSRWNGVFHYEFC